MKKGELIVWAKGQKIKDEGVNARVSSTEAIKKFVVLDRDFQVDLDEVMPTLKLKRAIVTERYEEMLRSLY